MSNIRGIIFDKDGTLLNFQKTWGSWIEDFLLSIIDTQTGIDKSLLHKMAELLGYNLELKCFYPDSIILADTPESGVRKIMPLLPMCSIENLLKLSEEASERVKPVQIVPLKVILSKFISMNIVLGVVTNDSEKSAKKHMEYCGVSNSFKYIIGYDSGFGSKPDPDICLAFCTKSGISPDAVLMVGDSLHDMQAGKLAGMSTVGVLSGLTKRDILEPLSDVILPDISFLADWLITHRS